MRRIKKYGLLENGDIQPLFYPDGEMRWIEQEGRKLFLSYDVWEGIPDEADYQIEQKKDVPSWRRICKSLLRNDYWCKGLSFTQQKSTAYEAYIEKMKAKREQDENQIHLFEN